MSLGIRHLPLLLLSLIGWRLAEMGSALGRRADRWLERRIYSLPLPLLVLLAAELWLALTIGSAGQVRPGWLAAKAQNGSRCRARQNGRAANRPGSSCSSSANDRGSRAAVSNRSQKASITATTRRTLMASK